MGAFQPIHIQLPVRCDSCFRGTAALLLFPFAQLIESALQLPYLMPSAAVILLLALGTVLLSVAVSALSSMIAAYRLSRVDPGTTLREGN